MSITVGTLMTASSSSGWLGALLPTSGLCRPESSAPFDLGAALTGALEPGPEAVP